MTADFFQQQDVARRTTARLVVLFALAVLALIASIELLLALTMGYVGRDPYSGALDWNAAGDPQLIFVSVVGTLIIVGGGSLYKIAALRGGGRVVAEQLGGRLIATADPDPVEQRLLNVVEEMAIASGVPTPPVYLLDGENGINAFAAGFTTSDAVMGITRGAATRLTRDELQGVVAHEFSHILNGDMRMDIRMMGLLHGILIIGMLGYYVLRVSFYTGGRGRRRGGKDGLPIVALGAGLMAIGFAGTFFGNLIKAAISRQREFLADASAVQFTRHPDGLAGALRKIGGFVDGSAVENPNAPEASHMFFSRATSGWTALFSTHPSLSERIRRIDPSWDGTFPETVERTDVGLTTAPAPGAAGFAGGITAAAAPTGAAGLSAASGAAAAPTVAGAIASVGQPGRGHLDYAAGLVSSLPFWLISAARDPYSARAVIYALLIDRDEAIRARQMASLATGPEPGMAAETRRLVELIERTDARARLPLLEMALPALRSLTPAQHEAFTRAIEALVDADHRLDLFEWSLQHILLRELEGSRNAGPASVRFGSIADVRSQCALLLSTLAYAGANDASAAARAFDAARRTLGANDLEMLPHEACGLDRLDATVADLDDAAPAVKRQVLEAASACVAADRDVTAEEAELLRAVSSALSCPMPPMLTV